jgi:hypothetical protein
MLDLTAAVRGHNYLSHRRHLSPKYFVKRHKMAGLSQKQLTVEHHRKLTSLLRRGCVVVAIKSDSRGVCRLPRNDSMASSPQVWR